MAKEAVGQGEVVDVRAAMGGESPAAAIVDASGMGNRHVQQKEVHGRVLQQRVGRPGELPIVRDVPGSGSSV